MPRSPRRPEGRRRPLIRLSSADAPTVARLASEQFGASAVVIGRVQRYREREGSRGGSLRPASVAFDFEIHAAPSGAQIFTAHFDHTQVPLSSDLFGARRYPGGGLRWLTAAELASWGAEHAVAAAPAGMR